MDPIVKAGAVLTVQFQRDVTIKREYVLMDVRLDGHSRHVIHVRHIPVSYTHLTLPTICSV